MTDKAGILVIEDEVKIARLIEDYLHSAGFAVTLCHDGAAAMAAFAAIHPDLVILDVMLPGKDGLTLCREIRQTSACPVILLTARIEESDRLQGLEWGADDYVCKPFSPRELVARVKAILRRSTLPATTRDHQQGLPARAGTALTDHDLTLDASQLRVLVGGHSLALTAIEFSLLAALCELPGRVLSRDQLMNHIYRDNRIVNDRTVDSHIKKLRKKLAGVTPQELIHSVYGLGYKFEKQ